MPFIIAIAGDKTQMFYQRQSDGTVLLTPNRAKATRYSDEEAEQLAADHNRFTTPETAASVQGAKKDATP